MNTPICPHCSQTSHIKKHGAFVREQGKVSVQRFFCKSCSRSFSHATGTPEFAQKKRFLNKPVYLLLASAVSQNQAARILKTSQKTIARKLKYLAGVCSQNVKSDLSAKPLASKVQFDELETFEHTKCKPISVALAVEEDTRRILGFRLSTMPANGHLAKIALAKYPPRKDLRVQGMKEMLQQISEYCEPENLTLKSDQCPRYPSLVQSVFQGRLKNHIAFKGARGSSTGQGEIKKLWRDPLFSLNHTCAMFRAHVNRLFRKTWNTTKKMECLQDHLQLYMHYHNAVLIAKGEAM